MQTPHPRPPAPRSANDARQHDAARKELRRQTDREPPISARVREVKSKDTKKILLTVLADHHAHKGAAVPYDRRHYSLHYPRRLRKP